MAELFTTRITDLFGTRLPIVAAGLHRLSNANYVAAAANAGLMAFLSAASFDGPRALRAEIGRCRQLCDDRPFGVNVSLLTRAMEGDGAAEVVALLADEGVRFVETSGGNPGPFLARLHDTGIKILHKAPNVRLALKAEALGVDAVAVFGGESGGYGAAETVGTMVQAATAARALSIPLVVSGGIGSGEQLVAALAMGADGVGMGSRLLVAEEAPGHIDYKRRLVEADENDTLVLLRTRGMTLRALSNPTAQRVLGMEHSGDADWRSLRPLIEDDTAYRTGDVNAGTLSLGQAVAFADRIEPMAAIVTRLEDEARVALRRLGTVGPAIPPQ